jgi:hypothetical protein
MRRLSLSTLLVCLVAAAPPARAQDVRPLPSTPIRLPAAPDTLTAEERRALDAWVDAMRKWQRMDKRWHNEPAHDIFGRFVDRQPKPPPPEWLEARCAALGAAVSTAAAPLDKACGIVAGLDEDATAKAMRTATAAARLAHEKTAKNMFLTRVHIDGLWTSTASDVRLYGLVGSHISLVDVGRVQFFGPPGVILVSVPDASGERRIRAGYSWGMSIRLGEVRLFAPTNNLTLFLTISKVWVPGGTAFDRLQAGGFDVAGFSLAPRKHTE